MIQVILVIQGAIKDEEGTELMLFESQYSTENLRWYGSSENQDLVGKHLQFSNNARPPIIQGFPHVFTSEMVLFASFEARWQSQMLELHL